MEELEKIDVIRERLGVSYQEAHRALQQTDGDVVQALIYLEGKGRSWDERLHGALDQVGRIIEKGNATQVVLKKGDKEIGRVPATVGVAGVALMLVSPLLAVLGGLGAVAALASDYHFEVIRPGGGKVVVPIIEE